MRDDIVGGLKNALERGSTIEQAIRSFINAGYKEAEVREAATQLNQGVTSLLSTSMRPVPASPPTQPVQPPQQPRPKPLQPQQQEVQHPRQGGISWLLIILVVILLLALAGFVSSLLFKEQIAAFFS